MEKIFRATFKKASDEGLVTAVIATMNVIDKDGDVILPGFFGKQEVSMIQGHVRDGLTLGKGTLEEVGDEAIAQIRMNLEIQKARDLHSALKFDLKHGTPLQEWSFAFRTHEGSASPGEFRDQHVQFLGPLTDGSAGAKVDEVSPVLVGAGENTGTVEVKGRKGQKGRRLTSALNRRIQDMIDEDRNRADIVSSMASAAGIESDTVNGILDGSIGCPPLSRLRGFARALGMSAGTLQSAAEADGCDFGESSSFNDGSGKTFLSQANKTISTVNDLVVRAESLAELRGKQGRRLSAANIEKLLSVKTGMAGLVKTLDELLVDESEESSKQLRKIYLDRLSGGSAGGKA